MFLKNGKKKRPIKREFSAGGAVFRRRVPRVAPFDFAQGKQVSRVPQGLDVEWLLIRPKGSKKWRLPKGSIENGESAKSAALREVWEETGIRVRIIERLDTIQYFYILKGSRFFKRVIFFLMESLGGDPRVDKRWAHEVDEAAWFPSEEAITRLAFKTEKEIIRKGVWSLKREIQEELA